MEPRTRLGPYEILSRIGAGGMGEVWRANDTRLAKSAGSTFTATARPVKGQATTTPFTLLTNWTRTLPR